MLLIFIEIPIALLFLIYCISVWAYSFSRNKKVKLNLPFLLLSIYTFFAVFAADIIEDSECTLQIFLSNDVRVCKYEDGYSGRDFNIIENLSLYLGIFVRIGLLIAITVLIIRNLKKQKVN